MPYQVEFLDIQKVEQYVDELRVLTRISSFIKPNQKQFKQANPELISAYFDKFSKQDLENVILPLLQTKIKTI